MSLCKMFRPQCRNFHREIRLEVDGKLVELPTLEGIIILNIMRSETRVLRVYITLLY